MEPTDHYPHIIRVSDDDDDNNEDDDDNNEDNEEPSHLRSLKRKLSEELNQALVLKEGQQSQSQNIDKGKSVASVSGASPHDDKLNFCILHSDELAILSTNDPIFMSNIEQKTKTSFHEMFDDFRDTALSTILSSLILECRPQKKPYTLGEEGKPTWWPTTSSEWWVELGFPTTEGEPQFQRPQMLMKVWKIALLVSIINHLSPKAVCKIVRESVTLQGKMSTKEKFILSIVLHILNNLKIESPSSSAEKTISDVNINGNESQTQEINSGPLLEVKEEIQTEENAVHAKSSDNRVILSKGNSGVLKRKATDKNTLMLTSKRKREVLLALPAFTKERKSSLSQEKDSKIDQVPATSTLMVVPGQMQKDQSQSRSFQANPNSIGTSSGSFFENSQKNTALVNNYTNASEQPVTGVGMATRSSGTGYQAISSMRTNEDLFSYQRNRYLQANAHGTKSINGSPSNWGNLVVPSTYQNAQNVSFYRESEPLPRRGILGFPQQNSITTNNSWQRFRMENEGRTFFTPDIRNLQVYSNLMSSSMSPSYDHNRSASNMNCGVNQENPTGPLVNQDQLSFSDQISYSQETSDGPCMNQGQVSFSDQINYSPQAYNQGGVFDYNQLSDTNDNQDLMSIVNSATGLLGNQGQAAVSDQIYDNQDVNNPNFMNSGSDVANDYFQLNSYDNQDLMTIVKESAARFMNSRRNQTILPESSSSGVNERSLTSSVQDTVTRAPMQQLDNLMNTELLDFSEFQDYFHLESDNVGPDHGVLDHYKRTN
ncbi:uncharacterized protein LOC109822974 [Asparagus officinalis]|uniref:uncharacterized protein LOC109822974 n=1 Tax=Asparagus officinalis TaxID=4686 RepID=UPI00098E75A8|nr:uncharacterized protein LOC109822974 [Asparagus officinalis]